MIDEMNKHAKAIQELNLSTKESLTIAIETLGMVNRRAEVTLSQAVKKDDQSNFNPDDYIIMTNLVTMTEAALRVLLSNMDEEAFDIFDTIFPLQRLRSDSYSQEIEDFRKKLLNNEETDG